MIRLSDVKGVTVRPLTLIRSVIGCAVPCAPRSAKYAEDENVVDWAERTITLLTRSGLVEDQLPVKATNFGIHNNPRDLNAVI